MGFHVLCWQAGCGVSRGAAGSVGRDGCAGLALEAEKSQAALASRQAWLCLWLRCVDGPAKCFLAFKLVFAHSDVHKALSTIILSDKLGLLCVLKHKIPFSVVQLYDVCQLPTLSGGFEVQRYCFKIRF